MIGLLVEVQCALTAHFLDMDISYVPGEQTELPVDITNQLASEKPPRVRILDPGEKLMEPLGNAIRWLNGDGRLEGPAVVRAAGYFAGTPWALVMFKGRERWINSLSCVTIRPGSIPSPAAPALRLVD